MPKTNDKQKPAETPIKARHAVITRTEINKAKDLIRHLRSHSEDTVAHATLNAMPDSILRAARQELEQAGFKFVK